MGALEKLLKEMHKDYSKLVEMDNKTHECEVEMSQERIKMLEFQNALNLERLEEQIEKRGTRQK